MTFLELCQRLAVEAGIGGSLGPTSVTGQEGEQARVVQWIRQSWLDIQGRYVNWKFLWAQHTGTLLLADGISYVTPPSDWGSWDHEHLFVNGDRISEWMEYEDYTEVSTTTADKPTYLVQQPNGNLLLVPGINADTTYSFDYFMEPQELTNNADVPLCPAQFHDVIVIWALAKYANFEDAPEIMQKAQLELTLRLPALESHQLPRKLGHTHSHNQLITIEVE